MVAGGVYRPPQEERPKAVSTLDLISVAVGFLLPPVIAIANRPKWPGWARLLVTVAACAVAGTAIAAATRQLTGKRRLEAVTVVVAAAIGFYKAAWHPSGVAPAIEKATSPPA